MFGRNTPAAMGTPSNSFEEISEYAPRLITPARLGAPPGTKLVQAACGRGHSILLGSNGDMWGVGANVSGQVSKILHRGLLLPQLERAGSANKTFQVWAQPVQGN